MKSFRDIVQESLTYSVNREQLKEIKDLLDYKSSTNGAVTLYRKDGEDIFRYDSSKQKLTVLKNRWQLMNLRRGY